MTWRFFIPDEFACACCGRSEMDDAFVERLDALRAALNTPLVITSGFRCPAHNQRVSRTGPAGPHTTGRAADMRLHGDYLYRALPLLQELGFTGIGFGQAGTLLMRFVHLDDLPGARGQPRPWVWGYPPL